MGSIRVRAHAIALLLLGVHISGTAAAAERISMPFDCRADGAGVELTPSPDRSYVILGAHESEIFSACSPADPNRCRSWFVHRFDVDCGGTRVAWIDVAAAVMRYYDRPGWVENGRFHVRMGPLWTIDGGSAFREGQRRWMRDGYGGRGGYDDDERSYRDARVVTLPAGFAPARGIPVAFSGEADPPPASAATVAAAAPPPDARRVPTAQVAQAPVKPEPVPELPQRAPRSEIAAAKAQAAKVSAAPEKTAPPPVKVAMVNGEKSADPVPTPASPPAAPSLTIINSPEAKQAPQPPAPKADETDESPEAAAPPTQAATEAPSDISTGSTQAAAEKPASTEEPASTETTVAAADDPGPVPTFSTSPPAPEPAKTIVTPVTIAAALALALAALAATVGFRRRGPALVHVTPPASRDYGSVSLDGWRAESSTPEVSLTLRPEPPAPVAVPSDSLTVTPDFPVPSSYEQALEVLGASPDASLAAIKKIVDGLRLNWHPDHARSEADRLYRESRSRQINVAWDLVSQHGSAA